MEFKLFGFIPGHVGLRGQVLPYGDPQRADTVQVLFEPTTLTIANSLHLRIGEGQGGARAAIPEPRSC